VPFYFINLLPTSLLYISILLTFAIRYYEPRLVWTSLAPAAACVLHLALHRQVLEPISPASSGHRHARADCRSCVEEDTQRLIPRLSPSSAVPATAAGVAKLRGPSSSSSSMALAALEALAGTSHLGVAAAGFGCDSAMDMTIRNESLFPFTNSSELFGYKKILLIFGLAHAAACRRRQPWQHEASLDSNLQMDRRNGCQCRKLLTLTTQFLFVHMLVIHQEQSLIF
jgi:hypothetical protein